MFLESLFKCCCFSGALVVKACDKGNTHVQEGNIGENASFPWLGVLRVHVHKGSNFQTALSGLLLIKTTYAIVSGSDVARVSRHLLRTDSKAMFITSDGKYWTCGVKDYIMHPEYEYTTYNTLALIELDIDKDNENYSNLKPICWPSYLYNASTYLYALGYTDENQILEKVIYKMQYVSLPLCEEFYNRAGTSGGKLPQYQCGYAINNKKNCAWDNGMVLASNSTGFWSVIGFGVRGPGCAAPARFINIYPYLSWIRTATDLIDATYF
ncbi:unnamed protein product [Colias eurytheme]|nr:unnamed protein product [Colias eurytheme]